MLAPVTLLFNLHEEGNVGMFWRLSAGFSPLRNSVPIAQRSGV